MVRTLNNNVTGGIVLMLLAAAIISVGVSDKGKQIWAILKGSTSDPSEAFKPNDPVQKYENNIAGEKEKPAGTDYGFAGEKGAANV